jgi:hypothetical protein
MLLWRGVGHPLNKCLNDRSGLLRLGPEAFHNYVGPSLHREPHAVLWPDQVPHETRFVLHD